MRELNEELIRKVLAYIEAHPEQHDQGCYRGHDDGVLVYCFAGHATRIAVEDETDESLVVVKTDWLTRESYLWPVGSTQEYAAEKLGLTEDEGWRMFVGCDDLESVKRELDAARARRSAA